MREGKEAWLRDEGHCVAISREREGGFLCHLRESVAILDGRGWMKEWIYRDCYRYCC